MRPTYESSGDRNNEIAISEHLSSIWNCNFKKLPMSYYIDWILMKDAGPVAVAEVKCRRNSSTQYDTLMLSLAKWMNGKRLAQELSVPFLIIVQWTDGLFYAKPESIITYGFGGRTDRNDSQDVEPMVYINIDQFKKIA